MNDSAWRADGIILSGKIVTLFTTDPPGSGLGSSPDFHGEWQGE